MIRIYPSRVFKQSGKFHRKLNWLVRTLRNFFFFFPTIHAIQNCTYYYYSGGPISLYIIEYARLWLRIDTINTIQKHF